MNVLALGLAMMMWQQQQHLRVRNPDDVRNEQILAEIDNKPEPMDVPAIQNEKKISLRCNADCQCEHIGDWTCADKSRTLLTAEDGDKHCVKFNAKP